MKKIMVKKYHGFSLVELVLAMALGLIILGALVSTFIIQRKTYDDNEQKVEMVQTARAALDMIGTELVMGGYDPTGSLQQTDSSALDFTGIVYDTTQLEIRADLNGDGDIASGSGAPDGWTFDENERIVYKLEGDILKRKVGGSGATFQPFAENITKFEFEYLRYVSGSFVTTTVEAEISNVRITIDSRTEKAAIGKGYDETTMTSVFKIRNMGMKGGSAGGGGATTTTTTPTSTTTSTVSSSTTTTTGETSTTETSTTMTTSSTIESTTTTVPYYIPPDDQITEIKDQCVGETIGVSLQQCTKTFNDYVLFRLYVSRNGVPYAGGTATWYIDEVEQSNDLIQQQPGWYGSGALCNCGTFINSFSCAVSDNKVKTFTLSVDFYIPEINCTVSRSETYTSG